MISMKHEADLARYTEEVRALQAQMLALATRMVDEQQPRPKAFRSQYAKLIYALR